MLTSPDLFGKLYLLCSPTSSPQVCSSYLKSIWPSEALERNQECLSRRPNAGLLLLSEEQKCLEDWTPAPACWQGFPALHPGQFVHQFVRWNRQSRAYPPPGTALPCPAALSPGGQLGRGNWGSWRQTQPMNWEKYHPGVTSAGSWAGSNGQLSWLPLHGYQKESETFQMSVWLLLSPKAGWACLFDNGHEEGCLRQWLDGFTQPDNHQNEK